MVCIIKEPGTGLQSRARRCVIQADTKPEAFPLTGAGVDGLEDDVAILPGSIIYVVSEGKSYVMNEAGTDWNAFGGGD